MENTISLPVEKIPVVLGRICLSLSSTRWKASALENYRYGGFYDPHGRMGPMEGTLFWSGPLQQWNSGGVNQLTHMTSLMNSLFWWLQRKILSITTPSLRSPEVTVTPDANRAGGGPSAGWNLHKPSGMPIFLFCARISWTFGQLGMPFSPSHGWGVSIIGDGSPTGRDKEIPGAPSCSKKSSPSCLGPRNIWPTFQQSSFPVSRTSRRTSCRALS